MNYRPRELSVDGRDPRIQILHQYGMEESDATTSLRTLDARGGMEALATIEATGTVQDLHDKLARQFGHDATRAAAALLHYANHQDVGGNPT